MLSQSVSIALVVAILVTKSIRCYSLAKFNHKAIVMRVKANSDFESPQANVNVNGDSNIESRMVPAHEFFFPHLFEGVVIINENLKILESNVSTILKLINQTHNISDFAESLPCNEILQNMTSMITEMRNETNLEFIDQKSLLKEEMNKCNSHFYRLRSVFKRTITASNIDQKKFFTETNAEQTRLLSDMLKMQSHTTDQIKCLKDTILVMKGQLWNNDNKVTELKKLIKDVAYDAKNKPKIFSFKMIITLFLLTLTSVLQPEIRSGVRFIIKSV